MLSVADVYADIAGVFTDHLDRHYLGQLNVEHWSVGMERALKLIEPGRGSSSALTWSEWAIQFEELIVL